MGNEILKEQLPCSKWEASVTHTGLAAYQKGKGYIYKCPRRGGSEAAVRNSRDYQKGSFKPRGK